MRKTTEIYVWLRRKKIAQTRIAVECGKLPHHVWETINGKRHDRQVLAWLVNNGCPARYLDLPADMRRAA